MKQCVDYIHWNPVKHGLEQFKIVWQQDAGHGMIRATTERPRDRLVQARRGRSEFSRGWSGEASFVAAQPPVAAWAGNQRQWRDRPRGMVLPADGVIQARGVGLRGLRGQYLPEGSPNHREQDQFRTPVQPFAPLCGCAFSGGCAGHGFAVLASPPAKFLPAHSGLAFPCLKSGWTGLGFGITYGRGS